MTEPEYEIWICPYCREQVETDDFEPYGHEHDEIRYTPVRVPVVWSIDREAIDRAKVEAEEAHRIAEEQRAADKAELERMEAEWRASAPSEQIVAYDESKAKELKGLAAVTSVLKETFGGPAAQEMMADYHRGSVAAFFGTGEEKAEARRIRLANERRRLEETIALFEAEGPSRVGFWKVRDARRKLAELDV